MTSRVLPRRHVLYHCATDSISTYWSHYMPLFASSPGMNSDEEEDESEFMDSMSRVKQEEIICLDVGGERHYVRRGLLIR